MMVAYAEKADSWYSKAEGKFYGLVTILESKGSAAMTLSEIGVLIREHLQEIGRDLAQGKMNEIGRCEASAPVTGADGIERNQKELMGCGIETSFGGDDPLQGVEYKRWGCSAKGVERLFPADGHLNLPPEKYTLGGG